MTKIFHVFVVKCRAAGSGICIFRSRLSLSLLLYLNISTILYLVLGRARYLQLMPLNKNESRIQVISIMIVMYIIFWAAYPKSKILGLQLEQAEIAKIFRWIIIYIILSLVAFSLTLFLRK
jgi:hypothetical protein